jgi:cytochrome c oxidase subunit II
MPGRTGLACVALVWLAACSGEQSALDPHGPVAQSIAAVWWVLFWGGLAILVLVTAAVLYAMFRRPAARPPLPHTLFLVGGGLVFPVVVLTALLVFGTGVGRQIVQAFDDPLIIRVTGHQWWWDVHYPATGDAPEFRTANELRLPVGAPIELEIESADVVHSFWIPSLGGKVDMIPGRKNTLRLSASAPGRFRAQCSEFCGAQHARMGFVAIAEPQSDFDAWRLRRAGATAPDDEAGLAAFLELGCGACHSISGTPAAGRLGPTLTQLADRPTLGASAVSNTPRNLRAWLTDHGRTLKPGNRGPQHRELDAEEVETLARLLEAPQ